MAARGYYSPVSDSSDPQLLRDYVERRSEAAFAELVRRHVDLVHSAALRMVRDPHQAKDVTQNTFVALSHQAHQLTERAVLSGWLHRTAQNIAAQTVRTEVRRHAREKEAAAMSEIFTNESEAEWDHIAPHLDAALTDLNESDRDVLMLRYFERKSAKEMAQLLGISDEAAQKRASRAMERVREFFAKQGIKVSASGLAAAVATNAVQAAPIGLATAITTATALAGSALSTSSLAVVTKNVAMTLLQKIAISTTLVIAVGTGLYEAHRVSTLQKELQTLRSQNDSASRQNQKPGESSLPKISEAELARLQADQREAIKLRGDIAALKRDLAESKKTNPPPQPEPSPSPILKTEPLPEENPEVLVFKTEQITARIFPGQALIVGGWESPRGKRIFAYLQPKLDPASPNQIVVASKWAEFSNEAAERLEIGNLPDKSGQQTSVLPENSFEEIVKKLTGEPGVDFLSGPVLTTSSGRQARVSATETRPTTSGDVNFGPQIDVIPTIGEDGHIELVLQASLTESRKFEDQAKSP